MPLNSAYGSYYYGNGSYGGTLSVYILSDVTLFQNLAYGKNYIVSSVLLAKNSKQYLVSNVSLNAFKSVYIESNVDLVYARKKYILSNILLNTRGSCYITSNIVFAFGLLPYEVDEFQVIIDQQKVKFYWKDSIVGSNKIYSLYESDDQGKTWKFITTTTKVFYEIGSIPFNIGIKTYKLTISIGFLTSYGFKSYPVYAFRRFLNSMDNGYWNIDPSSNIYQLFEGIYKEGQCKAELEVRYTYQDSSILSIRNERISNVYGKIFSQEVPNADENYRRKIWNLFLGFRNTTTYSGIYYIVKAFTKIPPRIQRLAEDGWVLGKRRLGIDTIPLSTLSALYGIQFKIHLPKETSGVVTSLQDSTSVFDTSSIFPSIFNETNGYYNNHFFVFSTGANAYKSKKIVAYTPNVSPNISRFQTEKFLADTSVGDKFFVTSVSTSILEYYIKNSSNLHSQQIYKYYSEYISENNITNFQGTLSNMEEVPSKRIRVSDIKTAVNDEGKEVQAFYDSGLPFAKQNPLDIFGGFGVVCWDHIEWGESDIDFQVYLSFSDDLTIWGYKAGLTKYVSLKGLQEFFLDEFIKPNSETVIDSLGHSYIKDADYIIDYRVGTIRKTVYTSIPLVTTLTISYDTVWEKVEQNQALNFTQRYVRYKIILNNIKDTNDFEFSGIYLKKFVI